MNANLDHSRIEDESWGSDRRSVLIVDDNPFFQEALLITLKMDKRIEIAGRAQHGREAVELASSLHPDVVLMDLDMPVLDGIEATRGVLQVSPATRVVVLTASSSADDERRARAAGADAYLRKGCPAADLFDAIFSESPAARGAPLQAVPPVPPPEPRSPRLAPATNRVLRAFL
jgi:DNA-binding NarL/FixJ family response regulator